MLNGVVLLDKQSPSVSYSYVQMYLIHSNSIHLGLTVKPDDLQAVLTFYKWPFLCCQMLALSLKGLITAYKEVKSVGIQSSMYILPCM